MQPVASDKAVVTPGPGHYSSLVRVGTGHIFPSSLCKDSSRCLLATDLSAKIYMRWGLRCGVDLRFPCKCDNRADWIQFSRHKTLLQLKLFYRTRTCLALLDFVEINVLSNPPYPSKCGGEKSK